MHVRNPFLIRTISSSIFYIGWVICLYEASLEHSYYGLLLVIAFLIYFLSISTSRKADFILLCMVTCMGPLSDVLYTQLGLLQYHSFYRLNSWFPPLWVFILWSLFAANIHLFSWFKNRLWLAIILGALGGSASYLSVIKMGGASLLEPMPLVLMAIGSVWALVFPVAIWLEGHLKQRFNA